MALLVLVAHPDGESGLRVVLVRGRPLELRGAGSPGALALGQHAIAPGGKVALEVRDQVAREVPERAVREWDHARSALSTGLGCGGR